MAVSLLGINHANAPLHLREQIAFSPAQLKNDLSELNSLDLINECLILSTCNRTEILIDHTDSNFVKETLWNWLKAKHQLDVEVTNKIKDVAYFKSGDDAYTHLIEVASGMNSMIIGEPQIFGQLKQAYQVAKEALSIGHRLDKLMQFTFNVTKHIRTSTGIGEQVMSFASVTVNLSQKIYANLDQQTAVLVGAGETIEHVAKHLNEQNIGRLIIANRSIERASQLANTYHAFAIGLQDLKAQLYQADLLISSTASPDAILNKDDLITALKKRKRKPVFIADLAVPRDIDPTVKQLEDVFHYSIDDLQKIIQRNQANREHEANKARDIISEKIIEFKKNSKLRDHSEAIKAFRHRFAQRTHDILLGINQNLDEQSQESFESYTRQLTNRLLHKPTALLRAALEEGNTEKITEIYDLFTPEKLLKEEE